MSLAIFHPHFVIRTLSIGIFPSAFYHPQFSIRILSSAFFSPHSTIRRHPVRTLQRPILSHLETCNQSAFNCFISTIPKNNKLSKILGSASLQKSWFYTTWFAFICIQSLSLRSTNSVQPRASPRGKLSDSVFKLRIFKHTLVWKVSKSSNTESL